MTTPSTQYVYVQNPQGQQKGRAAPSQAGSQGAAAGSGSRASGSRTNPGKQQQQQQRQVKIPAGLPPILGNRQIVFYAWIGAMILVGFDEWHNYRLLPRPSRFWYTSLFYGLLTLGSIVDVMVPLVNAFAIGYTIMLLWQYYNGSGQFDKTSGSAS